MQIFPAGPLQFPVPVVFMVKTFAVYLNVDSDHPKHIIKHIPIEQRLSSLSSMEDIFDAHKAPYEKALEKSGYKKAGEQSEYV